MVVIVVEVVVVVVAAAAAAAAAAVVVAAAAAAAATVAAVVLSPLSRHCKGGIFTFPIFILTSSRRRPSFPYNSKVIYENYSRKRPVPVTDSTFPRPEDVHSVTTASTVLRYIHT